jgi:hypothetical protein
MKSRIVLLLLGLAAVAPAPAGAATAGVNGVVVGKQHGLLLVAGANGVVQTLHGRAAIGARVSGSIVVGRAARARIHGIVVKRIGTTTILSSNKHLLAIQAKRVVAGSAPTTPAPGSVVDATVAVQPSGELDEQDEQQVGQVNGPIAVQATITAVGAGTVTLSVNGQSFTVSLPAGLTLPSSFVGQTVTLNVDVNGNGNDEQGDDDGGDGGGDD